MSQIPGEVPPSLEAWADTLRESLELNDGTQIATVLDLARDAATAVERPAAPLTAFLVGMAAGRAGGRTEDVERAMAVARDVMASWVGDDA
jgi:hypothetical protein